MIVQRLKSFPTKYQHRRNKFSDHCDSMALTRVAGTELELQAIADICFSVVECYSNSDFYTPMKVIYPLRYGLVPKPTRCIRLWVLTGHCVALAAPHAQPLMQNMFDDSELLQFSAYEEESDGQEMNSDDKSCESDGSNQQI